MSVKPDINIRDLFKLEKTEAMKLKGMLNVKYEDGQILKQHATAITQSRLYYELFNLVPEMKITSTFRIENFYKGGMPVGNTHSDFFNLFLQVMAYEYKKVENNTLDLTLMAKITKKMLLIVNDLYNEIGQKINKYVTTMNIRHLLEIQLDEDLMAAIVEVGLKLDNKSIIKCYEVLDMVMRKEKFKDNPMVVTYKAGILSEMQVKQILGVRGIMTEHDSSVFETPMASNYTLGTRDVYEQAAESRSAAKAYFLSGPGISDSEYFARRGQILDSILENIVVGDCGSKKYLKFKISNKADLRACIGKHFKINPNDEKTMTLMGEDEKYIGKDLYLRSPTRCKELKNHKVCSCCYGDLAYSIPVHSNIGHLNFTTVSAIVSQLILSTKHVTGSANLEAVVLEGEIRNYLEIREGNLFLFRKEMINDKYHKYDLLLSSYGTKNLPDIVNAKSIKSFSPSRITSIKDLIIRKTNKASGEVTEIYLKVEKASRKGFLTESMLQYIKEENYSLDENNRKIIPIDRFRLRKPFMELEKVEYNYDDLRKAIEHIIINSRKEENSIVRSVDRLVIKLYDVISTKIQTNLAIVEVIMAAFLCEDIKGGNFSLPSMEGEYDEDEEFNCGTAKEMCVNRSLSPVFGYEQISEILQSSNGYHTNKETHLTDVILLPNQVLR